MIPLNHTDAVMSENRRSNSGSLCSCEQCRARIIAAFAQDLGKSFRDQGPRPSMMALAAAGVGAWEMNGQSLEEFVKAAVSIGTPNADHININVQLTPLKADELELFKAKPEGTA